MAAEDRLKTVRDCYHAYQTGDRELAERCLARDLTFFSPADPGIDRARYFERCWPNTETIKAFEFLRLVDLGDEVLVTYEATREDGTRFRNTEILRLNRDDQIARVEVYFGWEIE